MDIFSLKSVFFFKTFFKVKSDDHTLSHLHTLALSIIPSSAALWRQFDWQTPLRTNCCCTWRRMLFFGAEVLHATDCEVRVQRAAEASEQDRPVWAAALGGRARVVTQKTSGQCYICAGKKDEVSWHMVVVLLWFFFPLAAVVFGSLITSRPRDCNSLPRDIQCCRHLDSSGLSITAAASLSAVRSADMTLGTQFKSAFKSRNTRWLRDLTATLELNRGAEFKQKKIVILPALYQADTI